MPTTITEISKDTDAIREDTEDIQKTTDGINFRVNLLIGLWILDKIIMVLIFYFVGKLL